MKSILGLLALLLFAACARPSASLQATGLKDSEKLYSKDGQEYAVEFDAVYRSPYPLMAALPMTVFLNSEIRETTQYLFGPLTHRELGGVQKGETVIPNLAGMYVDNGHVMIPYKYKAVWILNSEKLGDAKEFNLPLPYSAKDFVLNDSWKSCTEDDPEHGTLSFLWYYWDPSRSGCEHKKGIEFQDITVHLGEETVQTKKSYPEYSRMIHMENGEPVLAMTFAFGYVEENSTPNPFHDNDEGMREFQKFTKSVQKTLKAFGFTSAPVLQSDMGGSGSTEIGTRFTGEKDGIKFRITVVAAAGIDQMDLFAQSYAHDHEGFFGWFGHSRVGSGFDADRFKQMVMFQPFKYSVSNDYQLVFWSGCNSYSYYTTPFFEQKAQMNPLQDPKGTRNLDIISNALPTYFVFNAFNANVLMDSILNFKTTPASYQSIVQSLEKNSKDHDVEVIVNVLGDEDNPAL